MKPSTQHKTKQIMNLDHEKVLALGEESPASSRSSTESTTCMFSGQKRKRTLSKSAPKQRYLKRSAGLQQDLDAYNPLTQIKTKKQYWTEDEVGPSLYFENYNFPPFL